MAPSTEQVPKRIGETPPEQGSKFPFEPQTVLTAVLAAVTAMLVAIIGVVGFSFNSRFNGIDNQLVEIRSQLTDVDQRTSRIEGQLAADVLDAPEPELEEPEPERFASEN